MLALADDHEFQEHQFFRRAGIAVRVDHAGAHVQGLTGFERYGRLAFLLPDAAAFSKFAQRVNPAARLSRFYGNYSHIAWFA